MPRKTSSDGVCCVVRAQPAAMAACEAECHEGCESKSRKEDHAVKSSARPAGRLPPVVRDMPRCDAHGAGRWWSSGGRNWYTLRVVAQVLLTYRGLIRTTEGTSYTARACGRERSDGMWEGWVEFVPDDGTTTVRSPRETTQPNLTDLNYWATGLTPVYLEGALVRALKDPPRPARPDATTPAYDAPAPGLSIEEPGDVHAILDPFSVYAKGEDLLRQQLHALSPRHLRAIIRAHDLMGAELDLEALDEAQLVVLILSGVRVRANR